MDVSVQKLAEFSRSQKIISCQYKKRAKPLICLWVNKNTMAVKCFACGEGENGGSPGVAGVFSPSKIKAYYLRACSTSDCP